MNVALSHKLCVSAHLQSQETLCKQINIMSASNCCSYTMKLSNKNTRVHRTRAMCVKTQCAGAQKLQRVRICAVYQYTVWDSVCERETVGPSPCKNMWTNTTVKTHPTYFVQEWPQLVPHDTSGYMKVCSRPVQKMIQSVKKYEYLIVPWVRHSKVSVSVLTWKHIKSISMYPWWLREAGHYRTTCLMRCLS